MKERLELLMLPRTQRQKEILDYITRFLVRHGHEPSYAQIARHFGVSSKATIAKHITALEKRGLIKRLHEDGSFALTVKVEEASSDAVCEVAVLGRIAAGAPIDAINDMEMICVPRFLLGRVRPERVYALRVKGDSMIDEHICDGDIALIENRTEARDGEIVVALIDGARATLKRLFRFGPEVELRPANSQHETIRIPASQVMIQGIFRGLLRPSA
ncbi:MAG: transcriptional repressor LexA [Pyrinomonadaceae bacterium]